MKKLLLIIIVLMNTGYLFAQYVQPESAIWDDVNKRYYITNAGGGTITVRDWNGSTHTAWASNMIQPKAMLIIDSTLYVVDYTTMKTYNINTAKFLKNETVPGATFMNDICMDNDTNFYITETYDNSIIKYDWKRKKYSKLPLKGFIEKPNGIIFDGDRLVIVSFRPNSPIQAISLDDYKVTTLKETDIGYMDGIAKDGKGNVYISAWIDQNPGSGKVYRMKDDFTGEMETVLTNLDGPADIYYNQLSDTLVIPNMNGSYVKFVPFIDPPPAPELLEPANGSIFRKEQYLKWKKARAATTYTLEIAGNAEFQDSWRIEELPSESVMFTIDEQKCDSVFWHVKAVNEKGESPWSETWFMIPPPPVAPVLIEPEDNAVDVPTYTTFVWQNPEANYINQDYLVLVDTVSDFSSDAKQVFYLSDTTFTLIYTKLLPKTKYYWTVKAIMCNDTIDGHVQSFTTSDNRLPGTPELLSPVDKSTGINLSDIDFKWTPAELTDYYVFSLASDSKFKIIIKIDTVLPAEGDNLIYAFTDTLSCNSEYYWKVEAFNDNGGTASDVFSFETEPCTDVSENYNEDIKIIPNPASSSLRVETPFELLPDASVELISGEGLVHRTNFQVNGNSIMLTGIDSLPSGSYLLKITNGKDIIIRKLIINK